LLAVIGILVALATMTAISVARISKDTRITKAANDLLNVLESARAIAIRTHQPTLVAFRTRTERFDEATSDPMRYPNPSRIKRQWTEAVVGRLEEPLQLRLDSGRVAQRVFIDRFVPEPGVQSFAFPDGVKVAGNFAGFGNELYDRAWVSQPKLKENPAEEELGTIVGVLFDGQGRVVSRLDGSGIASVSQGRYPVMDFNRNGVQDIINEVAGPWEAHVQNQEGDESNVVTTQVLAVFDDKAARELYDEKLWQGTSLPGWTILKACADLGAGQSRRMCELTEFIEQFGTKIAFNRNTGRAEVQQR
jgi:type II secretory pathway pseudopilin PulG